MFLKDLKKKERNLNVRKNRGCRQKHYLYLNFQPSYQNFIFEKNSCSDFISGGSDSTALLLLMKKWIKKKKGKLIAIYFNHHLEKILWKKLNI